jgi:hypothetical protein
MINPMKTNTTTPARMSPADSTAETVVAALCGGTPTRA